MKLLKKRWWIGLILAVAFVIGWEEKRCQTQAYECRTSYAAQTQSERLSGSISVNQQAAEQEAITAACEPNGYFCRLFGAANLPTMLLVFIGIGAIWAALRTLKAIEKQADLQSATMQQWVDVEPLGCYIQTPPAGQIDFPFIINLRFEAVNNTAYTFDIQKIVTKIGVLASEREIFTVETNVTLASQESRSKRYAFYVPTQFITEERFRQGTVVTINGEVTFKNCLGRTQTGYFGGLYRCGQINSKQEGIFRYLEALGIVPERTKEKDQPY